MKIAHPAREIWFGPAIFVAEVSEDFCVAGYESVTIRRDKMKTYSRVLPPKEHGIKQDVRECLEDN